MLYASFSGNLDEPCGTLPLAEMVLPTQLRGAHLIACVVEDMHCAVMCAQGHKLV